MKKGSENLNSDMNTPGSSPDILSQRSMAELLSSVDPRQALPGPGSESYAEVPLSKSSVSNSNIKRSTFWGRPVSCHVFLAYM